MEQFIASSAVSPKKLILHVDVSDVPLHSEQELKPFHVYYG